MLFCLFAHAIGAVQGILSSKAYFYQAIINTLPARQRELVWLRFYERLDYDEIARKTGLAHKTVYNKIYEALAQIRASYPGSQGRDISKPCFC